MSNEEESSMQNMLNTIMEDNEPLEELPTSEIFIRLATFVHFLLTPMEKDFHLKYTEGKLIAMEAKQIALGEELDLRIPKRG